ncbi:AaceriADR267Wp [[Ashbya] aceris (nom. inval.)]|nr:AaceriADR267Wp [[Ashbya] aceris (nom. inval.)]
MSLWSFAVFWFYLASFFVVGTLAAILVLPFMAASLIFATGVVICGFFSNLSFRSAQLVYDQFVGTLQLTLQHMAEQVPPATGMQQASGSTIDTGAMLAHTFDSSSYGATTQTASGPESGPLPELVSEVSATPSPELAALPIAHKRPAQRAGTLASGT